MKKAVIVIIGLFVVSLFGCMCIDTTDVEDSPVSEVITDTSADSPAPTANVAIPKYVIGDVVGKDIADLGGGVIISYNAVNDKYTIKIVGNVKGTWMYIAENSDTYVIKRAKLEEDFPVLLAHIESIEDIPTLKTKDAKILSKSTHYDSLGWLHIVGEVQNTGIDTLEFVKVIATIYDKEGTVIGTDFTYTQPHTLKKGQTAPFEIIYTEDVPSGSKYKLVIDWN